MKKLFLSLLLVFTVISGCFASSEVLTFLKGKMGTVEIDIIENDNMRSTLETLFIDQNIVNGNSEYGSYLEISRFTIPSNEVFYTIGISHLSKHWKSNIHITLAIDNETHEFHDCDPIQNRILDGIARENVRVQLNEVIHQKLLNAKSITILGDDVSYILSEDQRTLLIEFLSGKNP